MTKYYPPTYEQERMIVPNEAPVPPPHVDLPEHCRAEYDEARDIAARSPRAAAALLRLCVQKLMVELGEKGKSSRKSAASPLALALGLRIILFLALKKGGVCIRTLRSIGKKRNKVLNVSTN